MQLDRVVLKVVERWVGKLSFAHGMRACCRSTMESTYRWLSELRARASWSGRLWPSVRSEVLAASLEVVFLQVDLRSPWLPRVEASDAAPGGHGRAWTRMAATKVAEIAQVADTRGCYTSLNLEHGVALLESGKCPLHVVDIDEHNYQWHTAARPGGWQHITLEEGYAAVWSLADRLRRPEEWNARGVQMLDSAALCGALRKGRSSSRRLNSVCRQVKCVLLIGNFEMFFPWAPSKRNPADGPSSVYGIRASLPQLTAEVDVIPRRVLVPDPLVEDAELESWMLRGWATRTTNYSAGRPAIYVVVGFQPAVRVAVAAVCSWLEEQAADAVILHCGSGLESRPSMVYGSDVHLMNRLLLIGRVRPVIAWLPSMWEHSLPSALVEQVLAEDVVRDVRQSQKVRAAHWIALVLGVVGLLTRAHSAGVNLVLIVPPDAARGRGLSARCVQVLRERAHLVNSTLR